MKTDLNNIVVELDDPKNGKELIDTLMSFGAKNPLYYEGTAKGNCYEIIDNEITLVRKPTNKKIITLDELKAMKEDKGEYPKLMYVGDDKDSLLDDDNKRIVFMKADNGYWALNDGSNYEAILYSFAQDIEPEAPIEKEDEEKEKIREFVRYNEKMNSSLIKDWTREMFVQAIYIYHNEQSKIK